MKTELLDHCNLCASAEINSLDPVCNIAQCGQCGYIFDNPRPCLEELIAFYSKPSKYDPWLRELAARERMWKHRIRKLRSTRKPGSVLDVGTGIGQFLHLARGTYTEVYGTEVSTRAIEIAREQFGLDVFQGTLESLVGGGRVFDNITLFHVLEHVPNPKELLQACHSLLSANGILAIAVPNDVLSIRVLMTNALRKLGFGAGDAPRLGLPRITLDGSMDEIHLSHFTDAVLRQALKSSGFSVVSISPDPCFLPKGLSTLKTDAFYYGCVLLRFLFRVNLFDATLVIARKVSSESHSSNEIS